MTVAMSRLFYVTCDRCGAAAADPTYWAREARMLVPEVWTRPMTDEGKRQDLCRACSTPAGD